MNAPDCSPAKSINIRSVSTKNNLKKIDCCELKTFVVCCKPTHYSFILRQVTIVSDWIHRVGGT